MSRPFTSATAYQMIRQRRWCVSCFWLLAATTVWALPQSDLPGKAAPGGPGVGVFGPALGIHGTHSLVVWNDLILDQATVVGAGALVLRGSHTQHVLAKHSRVNHLQLDNPGRVVLQGELVVEKSLVVQQGTFDTRTAQLILGDTCRLRLGPGAKLLRQPQLTAVEELWGLPKRTDNTATYWAILTEPVARIAIQEEQGPQASISYTDGLCHDQNKPVSPPPEGTYIATR